MSPIPCILNPVDDLMVRLSSVKGLLESKRISYDIRFPHNVYSLAQNRCTTRLEDHIHDIVQIYGTAAICFRRGMMRYPSSMPSRMSLV